MNDNRKIALNTGVIYVKLIINAILGLYTSRLVLAALGESDYGLYSVVGGIVTFLNVIGTTMVSVSYRFIAVEMGKGDKGNLNKVYNTVYVIHLALAIGLLIIGETLGLFYVNHYLNVLPEKLADARFVFHISLLTTIVSVMSVPANGLVIAKEKFVFTSIIDITSAVAKLVLVILLTYSLGNRLRLFAVIMFFITAMGRFAYFVYCKRHEKAVVNWKFNRNKKDYKDVFKFAWWSLFGAIAYTGKEQGAAMIINFFFGTTLNAAFGLATQINRYSMMFTKGLNQAAVPQIMKSYGAGNTSRSLNLVYVISRISTLILAIIIIPLFICMDEILLLWLNTPPEYTSIFASFMLINALVAILGAGFNACIQSTGNIKKNEIWTGVIYLSLLPIIFILYKLGLPPYMNVVVLPFLTLTIRIMQLFILKSLTEFSISTYIKTTLLPCVFTIAVSFIPLFILHKLFTFGVVTTLLFLVIAVLWVALAALFIGMRSDERHKLFHYLKIKIIKKNI